MKYDVYFINSFETNMGNINASQIIIATANYSGITASPFEFYSIKDQPQLDQLNAIFKELFFLLSQTSKQQLYDLGCYPPRCYPPSQTEATYKPSQTEATYKDYKDYRLQKGFNWRISTLDKLMLKVRYAPQYREDVGVFYGKFMNKEQFDDTWETQYVKNFNYTKIDATSSGNISTHKKQQQLDIDKQKIICKIFDFLFFQTFVEYAYKKTLQAGDFKPEIKYRFAQGGKGEFNNQHIKATKRKKALIYYEQFMERNHSKKYLSHRHKFTHIHDLYEKSDVVLLQDCNDQLINQLKNEGSVSIVEPFREEQDTKVESKEEPLQRQLEQYRKMMNIYYESPSTRLKIQYDSKNYILVRNSPKIKEMYDYNLIIKDFQERQRNIVEKMNRQLQRQPSLDKAQRFKELTNIQFRKEEQALNPLKFHYFGITPTICLADGFLFMSIHLSSKSQKKLTQLEYLIKHLHQINKDCKGLKIAVGGDFNENLKQLLTLKIKDLIEKYTKEENQQQDKSKKEIITKKHNQKRKFIETMIAFKNDGFQTKKNRQQPKQNGQQDKKQGSQNSLLEEVLNGFYIYPDNVKKDDDITTRKKRTWLQPQTSKSQKQDEQCRDFLLTNVKMHSQQIMNNIGSKKEYLPIEEHPYDHFFIKAKISL